MSFVLQLGSGETLEDTTSSVREIASVTIQERTTEPMSIVLQLGTATATTTTAAVNSNELDNLEKSTAMVVTKPAIVYPSNQMKFQQNASKSNVTTAVTNVGGVIAAVAKPGTIVYPAKAIKDQKISVSAQTSVDSKIIAAPLILTQQQVPSSTTGTLISGTAGNSTAPVNPLTSKPVINSATNSNLPGKVQLTYEVVPNKQQHQHSSGIIQSTASQKIVSTAAGVKTITSTSTMSNIQRLRNKSPSATPPNSNVHKVKTITSINNQGVVTKNFTPRVQAVSKAQTLSTNVAITPVTMTQVITNSSIQRLQQNNQQKIQQSQSSNQTVINSRVNANHKVPVVQQPIDQTQALQKVAGVFPKTLAVQRQQVASTGANNVQNVQKVSIAGIQKTSSTQNHPQNNAVHFQNSQQQQQQPKSQITSVQKSQTALVLNNSPKNSQFTNVSNIVKSSSIPNVSKIQANSAVALSKAQLISQSQVNVHHTVHVQQMIPQSIQGQTISKQQQQSLTLQTARVPANSNSQQKLNVIQQNATLTSIPINQKNPLVVNAKVQSQPQMLLKVGSMKNSSINSQHTGNMIKTVGQKANAASQVKTNPQQVGLSMNRTVNTQPVKIIQQQQSPQQHIVVNQMTSQKQPGCIKTMPAQKVTTHQQHQHQQQQQQQNQQQRNNAQKVGGIKTSLNTNMNSLKTQTANNTVGVPVGNALSQKTNLRNFHPQQLNTSNIMIQKNQTMKIQQQNIQQKQIIMPPQYPQSQNIRPQGGQIKTILPIVSPDTHKEMEIKMGQEIQMKKEPESQEQPTSPVRRMPLPYECLQFVLLDHNYGAPPPRTPPPASPPPHPQQQPLNGASGSTIQHSFMYNQVITNDSTADDAASAISSDGGREVEPEGEETETAPEGEGDDEDSVTRCICDFEHDDGYMICCDRCLVWQHVDCMGIDRSNIPDEYLCEICRPRRVDRQRARALQLRKREELLNSDTSSDTSSTSSADTDVGSNNPPAKKRQLQQLPVPRRKSDPPSSTLRKLNNNNNNNSNSNNNNNNNNNNVAKRQRREQLPRQASAGRKKETAKRGPGKRKTKRRISLDGEDETQDAWGSNMAPLRQWIERYEEAVTNHYSPELRARISSIKVNGTHGDLKQSNISSGVSGKCRINVQSNSLRFLVATVYLPPNTPIIELRGKYMLSTQHRSSYPQGRQHAQRPGPFVFFYRLPREGTEVCVDTRTYGNDARFVRRSCKPNAEIKHCIEKGTLHLYIVTIAAIEKSNEITIRHEQHDLLLSPNTNSTGSTPLPCACGNPRTCLITTTTGQLSSSRRSSNGTFAENVDGRERRRRGRKNTVSEENDVSSVTTSSTPPVTSQSTPNRTPTPTSSTSSTPTVSAGAKKMITNTIAPVPTSTVTTTTVPAAAAAAASTSASASTSTSTSTSTAAMVTATTTMTTTTSVIVTTTSSSTTTATATAAAISTITTTTTTSTSTVVTAAVTKVLPKEDAPVLASQPPTQQVVHSTPQTAPTLQETSKKDKKKMTREERKMEAIMKAFERLEKAEQRKQEVQARNAQRKESGGAHSDNDDLPLSLPTRPKQQHIERPLRRKRRKGRARTTSSSQSQNSRRTRLNSADSDMSSGDESIMMQSPPSSCIPNREAPFSPRLHTPTKEDNCVGIARDSNNQTIPTAADLLLALANSNTPGPSSPPLQQPPLSKSPTCDSGASSSSQSSTPSTPLSSACLLVAAAVGPLAPGFKFPKTKKAMMNEWLRDSPDTPQAHVQIPPHISPNMSITSVPSPSPVIPSTNRSIDFLSPTDPSPEFLTQSYAAKSLAALVQAANSVSGICDSPPQRKQAIVAQNANGCPVSSGSAKKRWLRQAISEECDSPNSRPESPPSEMVAPPKKRRIARESISSDNYTPPTTPTPVHTEAGPTNSALTLSENDFCEQPNSPLSMEGRIKTDYEADTMKDDTNSESEKPEFFPTIKTKSEISDSEIKDRDRGSDKIDVSVKDEVDLIKTEVKVNVKDDLMEIDEDNHDILTSVNLTKVKVKPDIKSQESLDIIKPSSVSEYLIKRESSSPLHDDKSSMEIGNQSDLETDEPKSPVIAMESDVEVKQSSEVILTYSQTATVNQTFENLGKDCKSNDASSIDEFDVEAQMKMITGDDGNDYKEKVDTCSDKDYKSMDGIEGLMDSSKEDSDSEDRDIGDLQQPKEEPRRFKELERAVEERAFKELETMSHNQEFKASSQVFLSENLDTRLKSPETTKLESTTTTTTTTTSEESMFDSVSSNIDCESAVVEPPKIFQSIPPLSERIRKKPDSSSAPKKSLVFEAAMIESTIDMESVEIAENGDDKNQLSTALREILRSKIDEEPTPFMNAENTDPPLENINPSPEDINPPLESINPSPEDLEPPINSLSKDIHPSPKETSHSLPNKPNLSPTNVNLSTKEIKLSPKNFAENINSSESINSLVDDASTPLDNLYPALEKMSPPSENFNSLLENTSPPVLNHIEAIVSEPSVPENLPTVPATKEEIVPAKVEEKVLPPPPPLPEVRRLKDPRTAVPNRCPSPKHDTPAPVKRKLSISEYRKRKQQSTETQPEPEPSSDVASSDKSPRGRSDSASSGTSSLSSDDDNAKTGHDIPSLTSLPLFANSENDERKGNEEGIIGWSAAPTLVERQRENLTERLKREFGLFLSDDEEERARKQGLTAEAILKARKEAMPNQIPITIGPTPYTSSQLPPQTYIPPPGSAAIHYPQFQVKPGMPGPYVIVPQPIPPPLPPPGIYPVPAPTSTLSTVGKPVPPQFLVPQAPPGANPYPPQFIPATSPPATTPRFPVSTPTPVPPPPGFTPTPPPQKPYYSHPPPAPRT